MLCGRPLTFQLKIGTPVTAALQNVLTNFGSSLPFCFYMGQTDGGQEL